MARTGKTGKRGSLIVAMGLSVVAAVAAGCNTPLTDSPTSAVALHKGTTTPESHFPTGVLPRSTILDRFRSSRPGVITEAKLFTLSALATSSKDELTQCQFRGCPSGELVWLVLQKGSPGSFANDTGPDLHVSEASQSAAWSLYPIDANTGVGRGDSEVGALGQLHSSPWGQLPDLVLNS